MGMTLAEKILAAHCDRQEVRPGELINCRVDFVLANDVTAPLAIEQLQEQDIGFDHACGRIPIQGLLQSVRQHALQVQRVDLRNSGDTAGDRRQVVGYGAFSFA